MEKKVGMEESVSVEYKTGFDWFLTDRSIDGCLTESNPNLLKLNKSGAQLF